MARAPDALAGLSLWAPNLSRCFRLCVGGGTYTKSGPTLVLDLVGKAGRHTRKMTYRNPATIADNVGDAT